MSRCPFCHCDPYHRVDNGCGMEAVAIVCCDMGVALWRGNKVARQIIEFRRSPSPRKKARAARLMAAAEASP